jgi:nitrate reductase delta subunit
MGASGGWARLQLARAASGAAAQRDEAFLRSLRKDPAFFAARGRLKHWVRARFALGADEAVDVREVEATLPGFPPRETVVEFWSAQGVRHHFKVFKALAEVREEDLPPAWMRDALAVAQGYDCDCC